MEKKNNFLVEEPGTSYSRQVVESQHRQRCVALSGCTPDCGRVRTSLDFCGLSTKYTQSQSNQEKNIRLKWKDFL